MILAAEGGVSPYAFEITVNPINGTLNGVAPDLIYTPNPDFAGMDSFTFLVTDTESNTSSATVEIEIGGSFITVNSTDQEVPFIDNGNCTLGEAIVAANTDTSVDACSAGNGMDAIVLSEAIYTLSQLYPDDVTVTGLPKITSPIAIYGNGATITRSTVIDAHKIRMFYVTASGTLLLRDLSITNGQTAGNNYQGGGIRNLGDLTLINVTMSGNSASSGAGAIYSKGSDAKLDIRNSTFTNNQSFGLPGAGAIYTCNPTTIRDSIIAQNTAHSGGGLMVTCETTTIENTLISENVADWRGGGVYVYGYSSLTINNSNLIENEAEYGASLSAASGLELTSVFLQNNCIMDQSSGVEGQYGNGTTEAANNWWGSTTGPGGVGSGFGTKVGTKINYEPFLTAPINDCDIFGPFGIDQTHYTSANTTVSIDALEAIDGVAPYMFELNDGPLSGVITGDVPDSLVYTPNLGFSGIETITYVVMDSIGNSGTLNIRVVVAPTLLAGDLQFYTPQDTPLDIELHASGRSFPL